MHPNVWGKHFWYTIHLAALGAPERPSFAERQDYETFYRDLYRILPCAKCSQHYRQHFKKNPVDASSRAALFSWTVDIHNAVNKMLGKPVWTLQHATLHYEKMIQSGSAREDDASSAFLWKALLISLIILFIVYLIWVLSRPQVAPKQKDK